MDTIQTGVFLAALRKSKDMIIEVIKKEKQFDKNSFRKIVLIVAFIFVISSLIIGYILVSDYYRIYSVSDEREQLEESIKQYANISYIIADANDKSQNSDIVKQVSFIGNNKFVLFKRHDELAYVELTRGFNNKYKKIY